MRKIAPCPSTRGEPSFLYKKTTVGPAGTVSDRETERQRDKETERQRVSVRASERHRDRATERQSDRATDRQRDRDKQYVPETPF